MSNDPAKEKGITIVIVGDTGKGKARMLQAAVLAEDITGYVIDTVVVDDLSTDTNVLLAVKAAAVIDSTSIIDTRFNALPEKQTYKPKINRKTKRW